MTDTLEIAVGNADGQIPLDDAVSLIAEAGGEPEVTLLDHGDNQALDPSLVASYLSGALPDSVRPRFRIQASTTGNAPYNLARRIQTVHRATDGRVDLLLEAGDGDEVSDPVAESATGDPGERLAEYAAVLAGLWETFPADALVGDQESGVAVDNTKIRPLNHRGHFYRVAGPIDGPAVPTGAPGLVAGGAS